MTDSKPESKPEPEKIGLLVVGLGGNNGVTMLAGFEANKRKLSWETANAGRVSAPNWNGCITQLSGQGVGYKDRYPSLADATTAAVSGWDIRPTKLGDALYNCRVLDFDLVRQVRSDMNEIVVLPGIYDPSFLGETQHETATHIVAATSSGTGSSSGSTGTAKSWSEQVEHLRNDIRTFIQDNHVTGHTTVIWSASVERPADVNFADADELLRTILEDDAQECDISPSILYAVAAALEGCSFVNGGSQNTLSPAMSELYETEYRQSSGTTTTTSNKNNNSMVLSKFTNVVTTPCYILGTDFKAGQTKFKTAAVEYIRCLGLKPRVIASSNHLGNNDMLNLTSKKTVEAKMRVKSDIFRPWNEDQLDHQVRVMYTPFMLDEKRDVVEYTSLGWLHCPHTMLTYTRCMDSVLCVPLMVDAAVWCDHFARHHSTTGLVARATAYLFKVPEGGAKGVDPGFQRQMQALELALQETSTSKSSSGSSSTGGIGQSSDDHDYATMLEKGIAAGIITQEQAESLKALKK
jgi:myo-inositol-1-phosphate synthase